MCASLVYWKNKTDSSFALLRVGGFNPPQHWSLGRIILLEDDYNAAKHCTCFGLSTLSAFPLHLKLRHPKALWSILIQASLYCNKESTGFRNCRSHWVPDWNLIWYPATCSAIKCMSLRVRYCHRLRDTCLQGIQEREKTKDLNSASRHIPKGIGYIHDFSHFLLFILPISGFEIAKAPPLAPWPTTPFRAFQNSAGDLVRESTLWEGIWRGPLCTGGDGLAGFWEGIVGGWITADLPIFSGIYITRLEGIHHYLPPKSPSFLFQHHLLKRINSHGAELGTVSPSSWTMKLVEKELGLHWSGCNSGKKCPHAQLLDGCITTKSPKILWFWLLTKQ